MAAAIYFISDIHLGDGSPADRFQYPRELLDLLTRIEAEPSAELVLLGDVLELWSSTLEGVMIQYGPVMRAIARIAAQHPVTYVVGNHDALPWYHYVGAHLGPVRVAERFEAARGQLVALHGHQYDPFNRVKTGEGELDLPWTKRLVQMIGTLQRYGGDPTRTAVNSVAEWVSQALDKADNWLASMDDDARRQAKGALKIALQIAERESPGQRGYPEGESRYEEAAAALMRQGARFVLMGHTHHPLRRTFGERAYVNTGSWVWSRYPPTYGLWRDGRLMVMNAQTHQEFNGE